MPIEIYVNLLDEASPTMRKTKCLPIGNNLYTILATTDYDPEDEAWEFLPGTTIALEESRTVGGDNILLARDADSAVVRLHMPLAESASIRPASALSLGGGLYKILPTPHYNPTIEKWRFSPGSIVILEQKTIDGWVYMIPAAA